MIVVDSSVWVEYLRNSSHPVVPVLDRLLDSDEVIALTDAVLLELLVGEPTDEGADVLRDYFASLEVLTLDGLGDFEEAAFLYRRCKRNGETIRRVTDCLIAIPVIKAGAHLFHKDRDFDKIARHSALQIYQP